MKVEGTDQTAPAGKILDFVGKDKEELGQW